jgi:hypothetical protein
MSQQWIQNQRSGSGEHGILIPQREDRADSSSLSTFARNFDRELKQPLNNVCVIYRSVAENALKSLKYPIGSHLSLGEER